MSKRDPIPSHIEPEATVTLPATARYPIGCASDLADVRSVRVSSCLAIGHQSTDRGLACKHGAPHSESLSTPANAWFDGIKTRRRSGMFSDDWFFSNICLAARCGLPPGRFHPPNPVVS